MIRENYQFRLNKEEINSGEKATYITIHNESVQLFGVNISYYPVSKFNIDEIFGEANTKVIEAGIPGRMLLEEVEEDFDTENDGMFAKFGFNTNFSNATFSITQELLTYYGITVEVDDIILYLKRNRAFQVSNISQEGIAMQIKCVHFNYDSSIVSTDNDPINDVAAINLESINDIEISEIGEKIDSSVDSYIDESEDDGLY